MKKKKDELENVANKLTHSVTNQIAVVILFFVQINLHDLCAFFRRQTTILLILGV
jgi:hypothetical protein